MALKVSIEHPHFPKGMEFEVPGLGLIPNGGSIELDEDAERSFVARYGKPVKDALKDKGASLKLSGTSLLKASDLKDMLPPEPPTDVVPMVEEGGEA